MFFLLLILTLHAEAGLNSRLLQNLGFPPIRMLLVGLLARRQRPHLIYVCKPRSSGTFFAVQVDGGANGDILPSNGHDTG